MLNATERRALRAKLELYEGRVPHMYLDSRAYVTVGVGHLLASEASARALPFVTERGTAATAADIAEDFRNVSKQPAAMRASFYQAHVRLSLPNAEVDRLTEQHIDSFHRELRSIYTDFDRFPSPARLALFDMVFNVGATRLRNSWPTMNKAISDNDWESAAKHSRRAPPVAPTRNACVRELFLAAARAVEVTP